MFKQKNEEKTEKKEQEASLTTDDLKNLLEEKEKELADAKNRMIRALADYDNLKKRAESEREEIIKISTEALMQALLPILDNLERAMISAKDHKIHDDVLKGFALIKQQFEDTLKRAGLEEIKAGLAGNVCRCGTYSRIFEAVQRAAKRRV